MSPYRNRLKTPEEVELDRKRAELKQLQSDLAAEERRFTILKREIKMFEQVYEEILGVRISELEDLEWQLKGMLGEGEAAEPVGASASSRVDFSHIHHATDLLDDEEAPASPQQKSLKGLYRDVAKAVHPDLASDDDERRRRQELMAVANQAYQTGDRKTLEEILCDWELAAEPVQTPDVAMELVRVIRQIARVRENILAVGRQIEELRQTDIFRFKMRVDDAMADGLDLLAEMAAEVDQEVARIRKRLFILRCEAVGDHDDVLIDTSPETRAIRFPSEPSCGMLYTRPAGSVDYREWQRIGPARGTREVFLDRAVRLDVHGTSEIELRFLDKLRPDDLQALFLHEVDDAALRHVSRLTGLQELFISNTRVTDEGLLNLIPLKELQRLSIYQTAITDRGLINLIPISRLKWLTCSGTSITEEGLALYRRMVPFCKAVSFKWRYES